MNNHYVITIGDSAWYVANIYDGQTKIERIHVEANASDDSCVTRVKERLLSLGYTNEDVLLALESNLCLFANISTEGLERGNRRRSLGFCFEEHVPLSEEEIVADYMDNGKGQVAGVCCDRVRLESLVKAFESGGIQVRNISPAAILAVQHVMSMEEKVDAVIIVRVGNSEKSEINYDLLELKADKLSHWWWFGSDETALREKLVLWREKHGLPCKLAIIGHNIVNDEKTLAPSEIECININDVTLHIAASQYGSKILDDLALPWFSLRIGTLASQSRTKAYRKPLVALAIAMFFFMLCVCGIMQWRGRQYATMAEKYRQEQIDIFQKVFPSHRLPGNITGRLTSEQRKLASLDVNLSGEGLNAEPQTFSAMEHLRNLLAVLPKDIRYRIMDLSIQPDILRVDGQAMSHSDAQRLATALQQSGIYQVEPPKTQTLMEGGVSFIFTAKPETQGGLPKGRKK